MGTQCQKDAGGAAVKKTLWSDIDNVGYVKCADLAPALGRSGSGGFGRVWDVPVYFSG